MKDFAKPFYTSKAWARCREAYAKSKRGLCERCLSDGLVNPGEIVHHKIHLTPGNINDPKITLGWDNLELVCRNCHAEIHSRKPRRFSVDSSGRVTAMESPP